MAMAELSQTEIARLSPLVRREKLRPLDLLPLLPSTPMARRAAARARSGPNSGPDWRELVGWKILLPMLGPSSREGLRVVAWPGIGQRLRAGRPARQDMSFQITSLITIHPISHTTNPTPPPQNRPRRCDASATAPRREWRRAAIPDCRARRRFRSD